MIRPHGLGGLLRIRSYAQSEETFLEAGTVFLESGPGLGGDYKILSVKSHVKPQKNIFIMKLDGLSTWEEAEKYRGAKILIERDSLGPKGKDEYFWFELIGMKVYLDSGRYLGTLREIFNTGSNDIYLVKGKKGEFLIPAIHEAVENIDLDKHQMIVRQMEGLFAPNEI